MTNPWAGNGIKLWAADDNQYALVPVDSLTLATETVDYSHHEIHVGNHYYYMDSVELNNAAVQNYLITTPDTTTQAHMIIYADGSAITMFQLYEATDKTGTTLQTIINNNRNSANTSSLIIHKGISGGTTDGTLIQTYKSGSATQQSRSSATVRDDSEIILKRNTKYIFRVTSFTDNNLTNVDFSWYEHEDSR